MKENGSLLSTKGPRGKVKPAMKKSRTLADGLQRIVSDEATFVEPTTIEIIP
jgi:hypothetical protein